MNFLTKCTNKVRLMKLDVIMKDIVDITSSIESPYIVPKRHLGNARSIFQDQPRKALSTTKRAKRLFIEESKVASEYNRYREIVEETKDEKLINMNSRYLKAIHEGDYKTARLILENMSVSPDIVHPPLRLKLVTESADDTSAVLVATNEFDTNLLITNFNILSDSTTESNVYGTMLIQGRESKQITLKSDAKIEYPVKIAITYTVENEDRKCTYVVHWK